MSDFEKPKAVDQEILLIPNKELMSKMDSEGILEFANDYFIEVSGYEEYELMGKDMHCVQHPDMPNVIFKWMWEKLLKQENFHIIIKNLAKDGRYYWSVSDYSFKMDENNELIAIYNRRKSASLEAINYFNDLYKKIRGIEKESGIALSEKFLLGHLEQSGKTLEEILESLNKGSHNRGALLENRVQEIQNNAIDKVIQKNYVAKDSNREELKKPEVKQIEQKDNVNDRINKIREIQQKALDNYSKPKTTTEKPISNSENLLEKKEEIDVKERIKKIREIKQRASNVAGKKIEIVQKTIEKSLAKPIEKKIVEPIKEVISEVKEIKVSKTNEISNTESKKQSFFQRMFGKTDEELEEEKRRKSK